jgi:hypothetical protein
MQNSRDAKEAEELITVLKLISGVDTVIVVQKP